jgi:ABC-type phosphonate transport system ATPase subunit
LSARGKELTYRKHPELGNTSGALRTRLRNAHYKRVQREQRELARLSETERQWRALRAEMGEIQIPDCTATSLRFGKDHES